jgi:tRNA (guanine37-N1)-methyltransferase
MFAGPFDYSIINRAREKKLVSIAFVNIRDFGEGKHKTVDDKAYGGGRGMILKVDVLERAIQEAKDKKLKKSEEKIVLLSPKGKTFNQKKAVSFSKTKHLILICGHYEGVDARIEHFIDEEVSIGDFITTGGEIPAILITDAVSRLINGVLPEGVTDDESFSKETLEYPQYTRPEIYKNLSVPKILISGNHEKIEEWKKQESAKVTKKVRPELLRD